MLKLFLFELSQTSEYSISLNWDIGPAAVVLKSSTDGECRKAGGRPLSRANILLYIFFYVLCISFIYRFIQVYIHTHVHCIYSKSACILGYL